MRVVIAGFGPFPGAPFNPSARLAEALARRRRPALVGLERTPHVFATSYAAVDRDLPKLFALKPDLVLIIGLAARRRALCIETRARNAISVLFPDASGYRPEIGVITADEPQSRRGNAPFTRLLGAVRARGIPARLSRDAGRYLCNYAYWQALHRAQGASPMIAFVHIPAPRPALRRKAKHNAPSIQRLMLAAEVILIALAGARRSITARRWS